MLMKQDDGAIQYTTEVNDIIDFQYQLYYSSDIKFWDVGAPPHTPSLWRGRSRYTFNHNIYAQKPIQSKKISSYSIKAS